MRAVIKGSLHEAHVLFNGDEDANEEFKDTKQEIKSKNEELKNLLKSFDNKVVTHKEIKQIKKLPREIKIL